MALECVGGAVLSSFLGALFQKLASPQVLDFFRGTKIDQNLRRDLENKLLSIQAVLDDAEQKQFGNMPVRDWLIELKVAMLDVEDVLEEIQHSRPQVQPQSESQTCTCKVPKFFKSCSFSSINKEINSSMKKILDDLDGLASRMDSLGLKKATDLVAGSGSGGNKLQSTSLVVESDICGRDGDKEMIINWLTSYTDEKLSILSIVGMGGLGKTTLAQLVYNDPRIVSKFDVKAWICVSEEFDVFNVSRAILDTITDSTDHGRELEIVQRRLKEKLADKKFLLVLDDVWNESGPKWEAVQNALVYGAQGSKILVTTRSVKVASTMGSDKHRLGQLQEGYCWELFAKHAFRDDNLPRDPVCTDISKEIVEKCRGLPLALKSMGSLLHNKPAWEWESVLKSEIWELKDSDIVPALALSYHHLPPHLKTCFAYCALFPKDYVFDKECLIQLWMAENFLNCHQCSTSPEEVGQQYFNDLLSRSFFQQSSIYKERFVFAEQKKKEGFVMHDLLNDLAKYVCGDIYFRLRVDQAKCTQKTTRHFSVSMITERYFDEFGTSCDTKKLRTFMPTRWRMNEDHWSWNCNMLIHELFSKFKFLRVLSLSHCLDIKELPDSVCNFKHLRSLDLSHTGIKKLPESTCSLYNLQILKLNYCISLKELPSNLHELTNLLRLEFVNTEIIKMPPHLGKLKNLQVSMSSFNVGKRSEFTILKFGELNLVRHERLSFRELQNIENPSDALAADLKNKTRLVELKLEWNLDWNPDDSGKERDVVVIENLQPSKHLEKLSIINYGGKQFPNWLSGNSLSNVESLVLENCQSCQHLPSLGLLPFLKNLRISSLDGIVSIGADFHGNSTSSFPSLERLKFSSMKAWEKWECEAVTGAFPCLQYLTISKCPKLKGDLPEQLLPLKELEISECKQLEASAPRALELKLELEQQDFGKLQLDRATLKKLSMRAYSNYKEALLLAKSDTLEELEIYCYPKDGMDCDCEMRDDGCDSQKTFPLDFFPALRTFCLRGFRNLQMITQDHSHNHLEVLEFGKCPQLESLPGKMHILLPSLKELRIYDCPRVESFPEGDELDAESFPDEGLLPLSLTFLRIQDFRNLKKLDYKGLCQLSSLKELHIVMCPNLQQLPEEGLPKSISSLSIYWCHNLEKRCQNPGGEDWPKIAHIPTVRF
ncbi:putative disease resistance RPP13-like protein 1 [Glycine soja]